MSKFAMLKNLFHRRPAPHVEELSLERYSSSSSISFEAELPRESRFKRFKTQLLTFLSHHYLRVIKALTLFSFISLVLLTAFYIHSFFPHSNAQTKSFNETAARQEIMDQLLGGNLTFVRNIDHFGFSGEAIPCSKIKCSKFENPCNLTSVEYRDIKVYACCSCLPEQYRLRYYLKSFLGNTTSLLFERDDLDVKSLSPDDLSLLPPLPGLVGSWDVVQIADTEFFLKYGSVHPEKEKFE